MFEDNPFYSVEFVDNEDNTNEIYTTEQDNEATAVDEPSDITNYPDAEKSDNKQNTSTQTTSSEKKDLSTSEKEINENSKNVKKEKQTGVSTYTEVPDITKQTTECKTNIISTIDKCNMVLVFISVAMLLIFFKKKYFNKFIEKITNIISNHCGILNVLGLALTFTIFSYPLFFGTGISGAIDIFTMFEFGIFIIINAFLIMFLIIKKAKEKNIIFKNKRQTFSGIDFLEKSLLTFSLTGLLFFFFTESSVALVLLYIFACLTSLFYFSQKNSDDLEKYTIFKFMFISIELGIIGILTGLFIIILLSAIMTGYYFPDFKKAFVEIKGKTNK